MMFMQAILNLSTVIMRTHGYSKETLGIWIAMASDEWLRGFIGLHRWHSRKWTSKALVANEA